MEQRGYVAQLLYALALCLPRFAVLHFLSTIAITKICRITRKGIVAVNFVWAFVAVIIIASQCAPSQPWAILSNQWSDQVSRSELGIRSLLKIQVARYLGFHWSRWYYRQRCNDSFVNLYPLRPPSISKIGSSQSWVHLPWGVCEARVIENERPCLWQLIGWFRSLFFVQSISSQSPILVIIPMTTCRQSFLRRLTWIWASPLLASSSSSLSWMFSRPGYSRVIFRSWVWRRTVGTEASGWARGRRKIENHPRTVFI